MTQYWNLLQVWRNKNWKRMLWLCKRKQKYGKFLRSNLIKLNKMKFRVKLEWLLWPVGIHMADNQWNISLKLKLAVCRDPLNVLTKIPVCSHATVNGIENSGDWLQNSLKLKWMRSIINLVKIGFIIIQRNLLTAATMFQLSVWLREESFVLSVILMISASLAYLIGNVV